MSVFVDVLAIGAHPDDIELGCGGLLLSLADRGYRFALCDLTAGEAGSRGDKETRAQEAKAAAAALGASARECLGLPDSKVEPTANAVRLMVDNKDPHPHTEAPSDVSHPHPEG